MSFKKFLEAKKAAKAANVEVPEVEEAPTSFEETPVVEAPAGEENPDVEAPAAEEAAPKKVKKAKGAE
jgi:hypothetical protein